MVLDILHSSELYAPHFGQQEDQMTIDLVGGLMTVSVAREPTGVTGLFLDLV